MEIKALIIEDSPIVVALIKSILEQKNMHCAADFPSGEEAIEYLKDHSVDIIFIDITLEGGLDGIETSEQIIHYSEAPFIFLTAADDSETIDRAKLTSASTFIRKPFTADEILTNIELAIVKSQQQKISKQRERLLSDILDEIQNYVLIINSELEIEYINKALSVFIASNAEHKKWIYGEDLQILDHRQRPLRLENIASIAAKGKIDNSSSFHLKTNNHSFEINNFSAKQLVNHLDSSLHQTRYLVIFNDAEIHSSMLEKSKLALKNRMHAQIVGEELEKERLSKDLHDGLGQTLNAIKMNINTMDLDLDSSQKLKTLINTAIEESHEISENLTPMKLQYFSLEESINDLIKNKKYETINIDFTARKLDNKKVTNEVKLNCYRITQEALSNVIKHSKARNVSLQLYQYQNTLSYTIEDDGEGFDVQEKLKKSAQLKNLGLLNMINRIKSIDGEIDIDSTQEHGTCINIEISLESNA